MAELKDKVSNALGETRTLMLGAEILLGFQLNAAFQLGFARLTPHARSLNLVGLSARTAAVADPR